MKKIIILGLLIVGVMYLKQRSTQKEQNTAVIAQVDAFKDKHIHFTEKHFANHA